MTHWGRVIVIAALANCIAACAPTSDGLRDNKASRAASTSKSPAARNPYSIKILSDPYVLEQQRTTLEALKRSCDQNKEHCELAEEARRYLDEQNAAR